MNWHAQVEQNLPRSYLVEGCVKSMNKAWDITKTTGDFAGAAPFQDVIRKRNKTTGKCEILA
jgi:hypothetical protein